MARSPQYLKVFWSTNPSVTINVCHLVVIERLSVSVQDLFKNRRSETKLYYKLSEAWEDRQDWGGAAHRAVVRDRTECMKMGID